MTREEVMRYKEIRRELDRAKDKLTELVMEMKAPVSSQWKSSRIRSGSRVSRVEALAMKVSEQQAYVEELEEECFNEFVKLFKYICSLDDSHMRLIITLRCVDLLSWRDVAHWMGGGETEYSAKQAYIRHFNDEENK